MQFYKRTKTMWILTKFGFFSAVQKQADVAENMLTVRSRVEEDLKALQHYLPNMGNIITSENSDYKYRVRVSKASFTEAMPKIAQDIDYDNFKNEIMLTQGRGRANAYSKVWSVLRNLQK
jgi:hypothetical protein